MLINVPQYIDVEDKVAGPLTAKQLGWMIVMGIILFIMWSMLPKIAAIIAAIPVVLIFVALAFYKPYGQPLGSFVMFGVLYFFKPKFYIWKRAVEKIELPHSISKVETKAKMDNSNKEKMLSNVSELAMIMDSDGKEKNEKILEILKNRQLKK